MVTLSFVALSNFISNSIKPIAVQGTFTLKDSFSGDEGEYCAGNGGYDDISSSTQVTVSNGEGNIVAVGNLGSGSVDDIGNCLYKFTISNIPRSKVYQFEVSHRGKVVFSHDQLVADDYEVELQLGD